MRTSILFFVLSLALLTSIFFGKATAAESKSNLILIVADDMGWGDVGYHGFKNIMTPNIDKLARDGAIFTQGYVTASVCSPSRSGFLTGQYQQRFHCGENPPLHGWPDNCKFPKAGLPTDRPILAEMLKKEGYATGMVGKWHLGMDTTLRPNARGFDFYFGFLNGAHSYFTWEENFNTRPSFLPLMRNEKIEPKPKKDVYLTDLFSDEAVGFIERSHKEPFFLYVSYNAVHSPWEVPKEYRARTKNLTKSRDRNFFAAMVLAMDDGVGEIMNALRRHNIDDKTAVIFLADNGTPRGQGLKPSPKDSTIERMTSDDCMSTPGSLRGFKGDTYEGGIRVPFCMRWPGKIRPGTTYKQPVSSLDIVPTFLENIGAPKVETDGVDLLPYLNGEKAKGTRPHKTLYWRRDNDYAIRSDDWKLTWNDASGSPTIKLFNLASDPNETNDLVAEEPERAQQLQKLFEKWDDTNPNNPYWGGPWNRKGNYGGPLDVAKFNALPDKGNIHRKVKEKGKEE